MTNKERKALKHSLKTDIDYADTWIKLALIGKAIGANEEASAASTREMVISNLKEKKQKIIEGSRKYLEEIDIAISKIS